ncbi:MAG: VWA domain-containing protein [Nostocaceae cyanobacterium]|nr:VWA domain-containing protein [Nostocaceae cyanobacterium]
MKLEEIVEFAENSPPRRPCVLLLDTSGSMGSDAINALNYGLWQLKQDLLADDLARQQLELAIVTFDSQVKLVQNFVTADNFCPPILQTQGLSHIAHGIHKALDMIQLCKFRYREKGIVYYRPWVLMITDGHFLVHSEEIMDWAVRRIKEEEEREQVAFFAVGVARANMQKLREIAVRPPISLPLDGLNLGKMFKFIQSVYSLPPHRQIASVMGYSVPDEDIYSAPKDESFWGRYGGSLYGGRNQQYTSVVAKAHSRLK